MTERKDPIARFWSFVDVRGEDDCWLWQGSGNGLGYGQFGYSATRRVYAHRFAYELLIGPIPAGLELDHLCRMPGCVNPAHLEPVTHSENLRRADHFTNNASRLKTHCKAGHLLAGTNLYVDPTNGYRHCRTCRREWHLAAYAKTKATA